MANGNNKNVIPADEKETRKNLRNHRLLWLLIGADVILVLYIVFQMVSSLAA